MQSTAAFDMMPTDGMGFARVSEKPLKGDHGGAGEKKKKRKSSKKSPSTSRRETFDLEHPSSVETASTQASTLEQLSSGERRKQQKSKKKSKKSSKKEGRGESSAGVRSSNTSLELFGASFGLSSRETDDDDGFLQQQPPSIIEDELMLFDRNPSLAEKAQADTKGQGADLPGGNDSINSTDSSIFSSYPQEQKSQQQPQLSYDYNRGSLLDDADSCIGGMR
jgi:hypothetical protein